MNLPENCSVLNLPLKTDRLQLAPLVPGDFDDMLVLCTHEDLCRYIRPAMTPAQVEEHINNRLRPWQLEDLKWFSFAVRQPHNPRIIGELVFRFESRADARAEIGYRFHPDAQGKGYALEATRAVAQMCFNDLNVRKLAAYCNAQNTASRSLLEKLGMSLEGIRPEHMYTVYGLEDMCIYGLLDRNYSCC